MELFPGVHRIESVFGGRLLFQYLFAGDRIVLVDTGIGSTPHEAIFFYLEEIGISAKSISMVIITHPDLDHHGGVSAIKDASPNAVLACGRQDAAEIEDKEVLYRKRYNFLAERHGLGFGREAMSLCPGTRKMEVLFKGNERIELAPGRALETWHVPGHSAGHLALYDAKHRAVFTSDAVQGNGYPTVEGGMAFGPTYYVVSSYLSTIAFLEQQPIEHLFGGHWPAMHGPEVGRFLARSRSFVQRADELIVAFLKNHTRGATLREILYAINPRLGDWPQDAAPFLQFAAYGHVSALCQAKRVKASDESPVRYRLA
ncbi:MAG: MBL fold metallo-hydrolase [Bryobacterales bacterium]|nr:MBL fold metallo-hydrolase [Bryobacterales bacterium]MEB2362481.1 MBL fold metallo-hydrolase [Bryobacterales bacterium]